MSYGEKSWRDEQIRLAGGTPGAGVTNPTDVLHALGNINGTGAATTATPQPQTNVLADYINNNLYQGVLGRQADAEGLDYWTNEATKNNWSTDQLNSMWADSAGKTLAQSDVIRQKELAPSLFAATQPAYTQAPTANILADAPAYTPYKSAEFNFEADPGYAFRKAEGDKALQAKQLASGGFFSGGALKEAADFNSGLASQEYGNSFNRYMAKDSADYRNHMGNFNTEFGRWKTLDDTSYGRNWDAENRDYGRFVDQFGRDMQVDNTNWSRLQYLDTSGQNAATRTAAFGQDTAGNIGTLTNYGGAAQAGGIINNANAWTNALGNAIYALRK